MRFTTTTAAALACLALAACGDTNNQPEEPSGESPGGAHSPALLAASDLARVQEAMESITTDCEGTSREDARTLVSVFEQAPEAIYEPGNATVGKSMTEVLEIKRDELQACGRDDLAAELDQALGAA